MKSSPAPGVGDVVEAAEDGGHEGAGNEGTRAMVPEADVAKQHLG